MYTLRFPFELPAGQAVTDLSVMFRCHGVDVSLSEEDRFYVLTVAGFATKDEADSYVANVRASLAWLMLNRGLAASAQGALQEVPVTDDPVQAARNASRSWGANDVGEELHGLFDGARPAVYPSQGNFRKVTAGKVSVLQSVRASDAAALLEEGMAVANAEAFVRDQRLQTALELYGAFCSESSPRAKFITLVMALEALAESQRRPETILEFLDIVNAMLEERKRAAGPESEEAYAFGALQREIVFRRDDSIRSQIRALVRRALAGEPNVDDFAKQAVDIYDKRSTLVHEGTLPQNELAAATTIAKSIADRVLKARFLQSTGTMTTT